VCAGGPTIPRHIVRTLLLTLQMIYTCLPFIRSSPSESAAYHLLTNAVTRVLPRVLDILPPAALLPLSESPQQPVGSWLPAAAQPVRQRPSGSRAGKGGRGREQGKRSAAAMAGQSATIQRGGQQRQNFVDQGSAGVHSRPARPCAHLLLSHPQGVSCGTQGWQTTER
jgi:hypothetical protein